MDLIFTFGDIVAELYISEFTIAMAALVAIAWLRR